ncbi:hypothetical protein [Inmirania thermothiophila]|uniref:Yip1 domain-containing protein n=1 Tax=Inmirania thermothiophila TaxID=1750597 RepID=A0A3N1Y7J2_9GAMM|nr:hypothetical protein [Inmirania thermothiophila]ROR34773.1 hypothetical protein EDC57_0677 [Inmirania thermothiophila]
MGALLRRFWGLCLLRAGPQDLPPSQVLAALATAAYLASGVALLAVEGRGTAAAVAPALADLAVMVVLLRLALAVRGVPARFRQTYTALTGSGALLGFLALPVAAVLAQAAAAGRPAPAALLAWLGLVAWSLAVIAHILRHALSVPPAVGLAGAVLYLAASMAVVGAMTAGGG